MVLPVLVLVAPLLLGCCNCCCWFSSEKEEAAVGLPLPLVLLLLLLLLLFSAIPTMAASTAFVIAFKARASAMVLGRSWSRLPPPFFFATDFTAVLNFDFPAFGRKSWAYLLTKHFVRQSSLKKQN